MTQATRARVQDLLVLLEKEFSALLDENAALRKQLEALGEAPAAGAGSTAGAGGALPERLRTDQKRMSVEKRSGPDFSTLTSNIRAATSKLVSAIMPTKVEWTIVRRVQAHNDASWDVSLSLMQPSLAASASADRSVFLFDITDGAPLCRYVGHRGAVNSARFHPQQPLICSASGDRTVHVWRYPLTVPAAARPLAAAAADADDMWTPLIGSPEEPTTSPTLPAAAAPGPTVLRTPLVTLGAQDEHGDAVSMAVWRADGSGVLSASLDGTVRLWNLSGMAGVLERQLDGHAKGVTSVATHPTSAALLLTASLDQSLRLWDLRDPAAAVTMPNAHIEFLSDALFMTDTLVVSSGDDRLLRVRLTWPVRGYRLADRGAAQYWDTRQARQPVSTVHCPTPANRMAVGAGGSRVAAPCDDGHVRLYDTAGGYVGSLHSRPPLGHQRMACAAAFAERHVLSAGLDGAVLVWSPPAPVSERL